MGERPGKATGLRIGCVLHHGARSGAGLAFLELLDALGSAPVQMQATLPKSGPMQDDLRQRGVSVATVPYRWWMDRSGTPAVKRLARTAWNVAMAVPLATRLRAWRAEVVYTNSLTVVGGALAARLLGLPHVWHVHELWGRAAGFAFDAGERRSLRLVRRLATVCVAVSRTVAEQLDPHVREGQLRVVYQAVSGPGADAAEAERPGGTLVCLMLGAVFAAKRQEDAVRALGQLARRGVAAELWLVGEEYGGYGEHLRRLAAASDVAGRLRFFGFRRDPWPFLRAADVVLSCCPTESFGRATVEAMLVGKPVVAARGAGNDELIADGRNGLLYRPGDADELAGRLERLAGSPAERRSMGEDGRIRSAGRFSREGYGAAMLEIFQGVARGGDQTSG